MNEQIRYYESKLKYEIDVWDLFRAMNGDRGVVVIDTRPEDMYHSEHIPGAINCPHLQLSQTTVSGFDRDVLYVTYCDGVGGNSSTEGALKLAQLGFEVRELMGGLEWWHRANFATRGVDARPGKEVGES